MAMTDPISDLLTRIRNAAKERHVHVEIPASRIKANVVKILKEEGFIKNFRLVRDEHGFPVIKIFLKYDDKGYPVIQGIRRVSRPGFRQYSRYKNLPKLIGGAGISIISTSNGVLTNKKAKIQKVGGEILCEVW